MQADKKGMQNIVQIFEFMNDIKFQYVVLRNWEYLPYSTKLGDHSDLDLLVYDFEHWQEIFPQAEQIYPAPRVQFKLPVADSFIQIDIRFVGDGYYPQRLEKAILKTREWNEKGFYTPNPIHHRIALAYHCVHHKNRNTYRRWLGNVTVNDLLEALKNSTIRWVKPSDPSVGRFNQYFRGATAIVEKVDGRVIKKQTSYLEYDLLHNEIRILKKCDSIHFPKVYESQIEEGIAIEDCDEELTAKNLPDDWKRQMVQIIKDLEKHNIVHRDIKPDNFMIKSGIIKLIDFGWARLRNDLPDDPPDCLGYPYKASWGFDDNYSMMRVIKKFEYEEEGQKCLAKEESVNV